MKMKAWLTVLGAILLVAGCQKSSTDTTSGYEPKNSPRLSTNNNTLTPTSRSTNDTSRIYPGGTNAASSREPDNTGKNVRDRGTNALTSGDQGASESDREITRGIRKAIVGKEEFSTTAKNIKIITTDGKVTLRGPVNSEEERKSIAATAQSIPGVSSVDNQLEVKTNQ